MKDFPDAELSSIFVIPFFLLVQIQIWSCSTCLKWIIEYMLGSAPADSHQRWEILVQSRFVANQSKDNPPEVLTTATQVCGDPHAYWCLAFPQEFVTNRPGSGLNYAIILASDLCPRQRQ